ncbi:hypothetical protein BU16DRAFT_565211 [Lophium mytilinum]|uniref:BTB domain-containing protein n=1 Tax=Lophium mytilinum TaxID=390894 RepID=A0A6A6QHR4_9PEZI|nr:hypothetical protein BU16DRAFT_565211 [Lophium mytilinum]
MGDPEPSDTASEMIVLHKHGDVIFELGKGDEPPARLLVSSHVLTMVSPVFRAMFTGGFAESQGISSASPRIVSLPDDDRDAMELICRVLHFDTAAIPRKLNLFAVVDVVVLSDKYNCTAALRPYGMVWIAALMDEACDEGFERLLVVAYGLDLPESFFNLTRELMLERPVRIRKTLWYYESAMIIPDHELLLKKLETQRMENRKQIIAIFDDVIAPAIKGCQYQPRGCLLHITGIYYVALGNIGLWPLSDHIHEMTLQEIRDKVSEMYPIVPIWLPCHPDLCPCGSLVASGGMEIKKTLSRALEDLFDQCEGLCLDCWKEGRKLYDEEKCRVEHRNSSSSSSGSLSPQTGNEYDSDSSNA